MPSQTLNEYPIPKYTRVLLEYDHPHPQSKIDRLYAFLERSISHQPDDCIQRCRERLLRIGCQTSSIPSPMLLGNLNLLDESAPIVGAGGSANVFKFYIPGKATVAVKKFVYSKCNRGPARMTYIREAIVISLLRHSNVISFLGAIDNASGFGIMTPYLRNGDLPSFLRRNPSADRLKLAKGIASGLSYLKVCGVVHSDIKGSNILVSDDLAPVISDFGLAIYDGCDIGFDGRGELFTRCGPGSEAGTSRYMAPERLEPRVGTSARPTFESDIFSFGMVLYEIYTGKFPYWKLRNDQAIIQIVRGIHPAWEVRIPDYVWSLALYCWKTNPSDRPAVSEVVDYLSALMQRET